MREKPGQAGAKRELVSGGEQSGIESESATNVVSFPCSALEDENRTADVERVNHYPLYELGKSLQALAAIAEEDKEIDAPAFSRAVNFAKIGVSSLLRGVPFPLGISKTAVEELRQIILQIEDHYFIKEKDGKRNYNYPSAGETLMFYDWLFGLQAAVAKFETIFSTEMNETATFFVPSRGIYSTAALIDSADKSFPDNIFGHVPDKAKEDWRAAGRCMAFSLYSATGFHVVRAVEATLEVHYQLYTGKDRPLNGWHDYIKALEGVSKSGADPAPAEKTLAELRQMKDDYRNPVVHPRVTLTENDARMLFNNGESLIIAMAEEIKTIRAGGVQPSLKAVVGSDLDDEIPF